MCLCKNQWGKKEAHRREVLMALRMPLTAKQLTRRIGIPTDTCSYILSKLFGHGLVVCLNPASQNSRLYWLSEEGKKCQKELYLNSNLSYEDYKLPDINWEEYGWLCFSHRSMIVKTMNSPMQPSEIKRYLRIHKPLAKISANNIRDVMKLLLKKGIVRPVKVRKKAHYRYELTEAGAVYRQLLIQADSVM